MKWHELGLQIPDYAQRPSGLFVPTDVSAQTVAPVSLPAGLNLRRAARPAYIERRQVAPIDSIVSWIDESELGFPPTSLDDLDEMVELLPFDGALFALAWLLRRVHPIRSDARAQASLAAEFYGRIPGAAARIDVAVSQERARLPFAEPLLIPLARMLIESASPESRLDDVGDARLVFQRCVLGVASAFHDRTFQGNDPADVAAWLGFFMCKSNLMHGTATLNEVVRPHELFRLMRGPLDGRAEAERCDVDDAMVSHYGLTIAEQFRLGITLAGMLEIWDDEGAGASVMRLAPGAFGKMASSIGLADKAEAALDLVSGTREHFRDEFERLDPDRSLLISLHLPFQQRPFVRLQDDSLVLVSPRFLHEWLGDGFHYRALDAMAGVPRDTAKSGRYLRFAGHVFERYCVDVAKSSHRRGLGESPIVSGDMTYSTRHGERRTVDLAVAAGADLVLFEIEHHRPGADVSIRASTESAATDVREHVVAQVRALGNCIQALRDPAGPRVEDLDMRHVRRIWPVVVSVDTPPQQPPLWDFVDREVGTLLADLGAEPVTILDAEDFETLCGLVEAGHTLGGLLARKTAPEFARADLRIWLANDPLAPQRLRPQRLEAAFKRLIEDAGAEMNPNGWGNQVDDVAA